MSSMASEFMFFPLMTVLRELLGELQYITALCVCSKE